MDAEIEILLGQVKYSYLIENHIGLPSHLAILSSSKRGKCLPHRSLLSSCQKATPGLVYVKQLTRSHTPDSLAKCKEPLRLLFWPLCRLVVVHKSWICYGTKRFFFFSFPEKRSSLSLLQTPLFTVVLLFVGGTTMAIKFGERTVQCASDKVNGSRLSLMVHVG